jgi:putative ABC transport system permease protein
MGDAPRWRRYLRFWGADVNADVAEEFRFHIEAEVEELVARGMTPEAARADAERRFGDMEYFRRYCSEADTRRAASDRRTENFAVLKQDLRYAVRSLRRQPGFAAVAALTLALGIGANTAIFSVVNGVLLTPLPYKDPERLVTLWESTRDMQQIVVSYPNYLDWKTRTRTFQDIAVYNRYEDFNLTGRGDAERVSGALVSANLFSLLGVPALLGRSFTPGDDRIGADRVAMMSHGFWQRGFGGEPRIVGTQLMLDGVNHTVVGVLPPSMRLANRDVWVPVGPLTNTPRFARSSHPGLVGIGRLKPGVSIDQMSADLSDVAAQLAREYPNDNAGIGAHGAPMMEIVVGQVRRALVVLSVAVGFVLLIACANVANLVLARSTARVKEFGLRVAIGAGRGRLVRQLLTESLVLSTIGGVLATGLAWAGVKLLLQLRPGSVPRLAEVQLDGTALLYALGLTLLTGVLFGIFPAIQAIKSDHLSALKEGGRGSAGGVRQRARAILTAAEVALALVLLAGAGLLLRSFANLTRVDLGVNPDNVVAAEIRLSQTRYASTAERQNGFAAIVEHVRQVPSVESAAASSDLPITSTSQTGITFEGLPPVERGSEPMLNGSLVSPEYFATTGMRILRGREISATDRADQPWVVVINETVAKRFFGNADPVGRRLTQGIVTDSTRWMTIVGVVSDTRTNGLTETPRGTFYQPIMQADEDEMWLIVRSTMPAEQLTPALRRAVAEVDPNLPLANVTTLRAVVEGEVAQPRFSMLMLSIFAAVALMLAAIGLYGVLSYDVAQRWSEIGVRVALGATRRDVLRLIVGRAMKITAAGLAIGVGIALASGEVIARLLYDVQPRDPLVLGAVTLFLAAVALAAAALPAYRATRIAPTVAIRGD